MRIRPQTQPTLVSSCADRLLLRFPISDQPIPSCLFFFLCGDLSCLCYSLLQLIISGSLHMDEHKLPAGYSMAKEGYLSELLRQNK